jgi:hypothetical protein
MKVLSEGSCGASVGAEGRVDASGGRVVFTRGGATLYGTLGTGVVRRDARRDVSGDCDASGWRAVQSRREPRSQLYWSLVSVVVGAVTSAGGAGSETCVDEEDEDDEDVADRLASPCSGIPWKAMPRFLLR